MTNAELVNRILETLMTGRVRFVDIGGEPGPIMFEWGYNTYVVGVGDDGLIYECGPAPEQYGCWMEGVLNGKTRDDEGALVDA